MPNKTSVFNGNSVIAKIQIEKYIVETLNKELFREYFSKLYSNVFNI